MISFRPLLAVEHSFFCPHLNRIFPFFRTNFQYIVYTFLRIFSFRFSKQTLLLSQTIDYCLGLFRRSFSGIQPVQPDDTKEEKENIQIYQHKPHLTANSIEI